MPAFSRLIAATLVVALSATSAFAADGISVTACKADGTANGTAVKRTFTSGTEVCTKGALSVIPATTTMCNKEVSTCVGTTSYATTDCSGTAQAESFGVCDKCLIVGATTSLKVECSKGSSEGKLNIYTTAKDCTGSATSKDVTSACSVPLGSSGIKVTTPGFACNTVAVVTHKGQECTSDKTATKTFVIQDKCMAGVKQSCPTSTKDSVSSASVASVMAVVGAAILAVIA